MGQYFSGYIKEKDGTRNRITDPYFEKLMEHSYFLNPAVRVAAHVIYKNPAQMAWIGNYGDKICNAIGESDAFDFAWGESSEMKVYQSDKEQERPEPLKLEGKYFVNHDRHEYVDLEKAARLSQIEGTADDETTEGIVALNPITLMTAVGNTLGGGDYFGTNMDLVGKWAFETLSIEDEAPEEFKEIEASFHEDRSVMNQYMVEALQAWANGKPGNGDLQLIAMLGGVHK